MFWDVFVRLCQFNKVSPNTVARKCGVKSTGTVTAWKKGAMPRDGVMAAIADYFGVTVEFLAGGTDEAYLFETKMQLSDAMKAYDKESNPQKKYDLACEIDALRESIADQNFAMKTKNAPTVNIGRAVLTEEGHHIGFLFDKADEKDKLLTHTVLDKYDEVGNIVSINTKRNNPGDMVEIDVYDEPAAAGLGNYLDAPQSHHEQFPSFVIPKGTSFGIRISGNSMMPLVEDGTTVFVKHTPVVESGKVGIFVLNGKSFCKQLIVDHAKEEVRLHSFNPDYDDIIITPADDLRTIGQVL